MLISFSITLTLTQPPLFECMYIKFTASSVFIYYLPKLL